MLISRLISVGLSFLFANHASSSPIHGLTRYGEETINHGARTTLSSPYFVVHSDRLSDSWYPPDPSLITGFNVYCLDFLLLSGASDTAQAWASLTGAQRSSVKKQYANAGIKLIVSTFGSTDQPTTWNTDPTATANTFASWVIKYQLDGIDIDYEDFGAFKAGNGKAENWLIAFTRRLRNRLPAGQYLITHAPVAPWFAPNKWGGGGYLKIHSAVGSLIDWYNVQFYNQGPAEYITCSNLLYTSTSKWPNSALFQISGNGVPLSKIVVGKPAAQNDTFSGYMDPKMLAACLTQGQNRGWDGGVVGWEYPEANPNWIATVRSQTWPVDKDHRRWTRST
ncbi:hypothetical protein APHAL10511_006834 [Amanita phalloides]|nr:hypothetical protein APHAL10511_006834 [Amanita phalloides]